MLLPGHAGLAICPLAECTRFFGAWAHRDQTLQTNHEHIYGQQELWQYLLCNVAFITTIRFCGGNLCSDDGDMWLQVAPRIKDAMQQAGDAMIGFQPLQGLPNFFRIVFPSAWTVTTADLDALMTRIEDFGNKLFPALQQ